MDPTLNTDDMIEATDCLEAVGVFKSMKNIFFILVCFSLIFLQIAFWLNHTDCIDKSNSPYAKKAVLPGVPCPPGPLSGLSPIGPRPPAAGYLIGNEDTADKKDTADEKDTTGKKDTARKDDKAEEKIDELVKEADELSKKTAETKAQRARVVPPEDKGLLAELFIPEVEQVTALIRTSNFILIVSACMYCLTLLVSVKISLAGRLGGINHISRGFFRSLFAFVLLMPWQLITDGVVTGAVFTPKELFAPKGLIAQPTLMGQTFYYLRFPGLWAVVFILLVAAQFSSKKWAKATLRRLGIAH